MKSCTGQAPGCPDDIWSLGCLDGDHDPIKTKMEND